MASPQQRPWWPGAVTGAVALAAAVSVGPALVSGGLAPLAVAALVAALVGVPVARVEWRERPDLQTASGRFSDALGEVLVLTWLAALWAQTWPGLAGGAVGISLWLVALAAVLLRKDLAVVGLVALCVLQSALGVGLGALEHAPWTLLQPQWNAWSDWLPWSLVTGLLLAGAGLAHWSRGAAAPPGTGHVPWLSTGLALLVGLATACRAGSRFETDLAFAPDSLALGVSAIAIATACSATLSSSPSNPRRSAAIGVVATLWFAAPGAGSLGWLFAVWLPAGMLGVLSLRAVALEGNSRVVCGAGAGLAAFALLWGWPGVPPSPPAAVASALTGVMLLWFAGTRTLVRG